MALQKLGDAGDLWTFKSAVFSALGFRAPTGGPALAAVQSGVQATATLENVHDQVAADTDLSEGAKQRRMQPVRERTAAVISEARRQVQTLVDGREREVQGLLAVPDVTSAVAELRDQEIRAGFVALPAVVRSHVEASMASGDDDRTLLAICRGPFALPEVLAARALWRSRQEALHAERLAQLADREENEQRGLVALDAMKGAVERFGASSAGSSDRPRVGGLEAPAGRA